MSAPAPGGTSLKHLIASMEPTLQPGSYVFATAPPSDTSFQDRLKSLPFEMLFREREGWTVIAEQATIDALGLEAMFPCRKVTLGVHSSLEAVGFMAAVTTRLAESGLGINPVSGFYHDHLFVPEGKEGHVVYMLKTMADESKTELNNNDATKGSGK